MRTSTDLTLAAIDAGHHPLAGADDDHDRLVARAARARVVLLGEASHGTHEFYAERARITRRLIEEQRLHAVAVEADWPDAWRVNRYVRGLDDDDWTGTEALAGFRRFPGWMWRNREVLEFVEWLRAHNDELPPDERTGFYGVDLYSLYASIDAVIETLSGIDPTAAEQARRRYACFGSAGTARSYGQAAALGALADCEEDAVQQLLDLQAERTRVARDQAATDGDRDALFCAVQNARLVVAAERYYRTMYRGDASTWNLRDRHMADTIDALMEHLGPDDSRIAVWEHNSHLGDARATEMALRGELNVGQLVRERHGSETFSVGFSTFEGEVTAAHAWDEPGVRMRVRPALPGSYEHLMRRTGLGDFMLLLDDDHDVTRRLEEPRLQRAIGVIYRPRTERASHYFQATLAKQFDALVHIDETRAVQPLDPSTRWVTGEPPEAYPTGL